MSKITRANVAEYVEGKGYEPVQIDGIPEGFSFKEPSITIGGVHHEGKYTAFIPLKRWDEICRVWSISEEGLLTVYKEYNNGK